ncbi:hypothetical protein VT84_15310 [Gemmata sp. SH-PL17]|uniref:PEP-CTERM sorting domain-containing protein n=1 Tax=Gemmata sp. SH-PL17 TaxID=1630693 RepID=UPI0004B2A98B|nr:PEP-CTERM sorting domain-containing protein [Gemmata sp. SH-PL17]AMV25764.1 hypothetical protein VT84_15310 [Gemmata sp. SH-PL17]
MIRSAQTFIISATLALTFHLVTASDVRAGFIKNISTGFNNTTSTLLSDGTADDDYVIGSGGTGGHSGEVPLVRTAPLPGTWLADSASTGSRWLVLSGKGLEGVDVGAGVFFFDIVVDLTGFDPATAQIAGLRYSADNKLVAVRINGTAVFTQDGSFAEEFQSFRDLGSVGLGQFHSGLNVIRFEVDNQLGSDSPLGLRVEGTVEGQSVTATPEPSGLMLLATGAVTTLGWKRLRKTNRAER